MAVEFRGEDFECLGENAEKYISFSVPIKKECNNDSGETTTYKVKFIKDCKTCMGKKNQNVNLLGLKIID